MRISLVRVPRLPKWPWWLVAILASWFALLGTTYYLATRTGREVTVCLFRRITHLPCPSCGATRGVISLLSGHPLRAWSYNPLVMTVICAIVALAVLRLVFGLVVDVSFSPRQKHAAMACAAALMLANWIYVLGWGV